MAEAHTARSEKSVPHASQRGAYDTLIPVDMLPGEHGWLSLDAAGAPVAVTKAVPAVGTPATRVMHTNALVPPFDALCTVAGAPISAIMQPSPDYREAEEAGAMTAKAEKSTAKSDVKK